MEVPTPTRDRTRPSTAAIIGTIGAILVAVSPFLKWITLQLDFTKIADVLGLPPGTPLPAGYATFKIADANGFDEKMYGIITLVAGILALAGFVQLLLGTASRRRMAATLGIVGAAIGGLWAAYTVFVRVDSLLDNEASHTTTAELGQLPPGLSVDRLRDALTSSPKIGLWVALIGMLLAVVGGVMALRESPAEAAASPMSTAPAGGFASPPPAAPASPSVPSPTESSPSTEAMPPVPPEGPPSSIP